MSDCAGNVISVKVWVATISLLVTPAAPSKPGQMPRKKRDGADQWKVVALHKIAPPGRPPCWSSRRSWIEYLEHIVTSTKQRHADGPLALAPGQRAVLNPQFNKCDDCTPGHQRAMTRVGRCNPYWWRREVARTEESNHAT